MKQHHDLRARVGAAILRAAGSAIVLTVVFGGCQLLEDAFSDSQALDRIAAFETTLNGDRSNIAEHLHSDADDKYNSPDTWRQFFPSNVDLSFADSAEAAETDGGVRIYAATVTAEPDTSELHEARLEFGLEEDPDNDNEVRILSLSIIYPDGDPSELF